MFLLGSAYPTAKLALNASVPPILFGSIRMAIVFIFLIPFCKIEVLNKKYFFPLIGFSLCMGIGVNLFLYLSINASSIISPIVIGAQLSIPLAIIVSSIFMGETISFKKWILIITSFFGITLIGFDPKIHTKYSQLSQYGLFNIKLYIGGLFEWLLLQEVYGSILFPTTSSELDILKYK